MATENLSITSSADDGNESGTSWVNKTDGGGDYAGNEYFSVGERSGNQAGALRFQVPNIGQGETIVAAVLTAYFTGSGGGPTGSITVRVHGFDGINAAALSNSFRPSAGWTDTTASADATFSTADAAQDITWDVTSVVQEIVDNEGWAADNYMAFALRGVAASYRTAYFADYDPDTIPNVARLDIEYGASGANTSILVPTGPVR